MSTKIPLLIRKLQILKIVLIYIPIATCTRSTKRSRIQQLHVCQPFIHFNIWNICTRKHYPNTLTKDLNKKYWIHLIQVYNWHVLYQTQNSVCGSKPVLDAAYRHFHQKYLSGNIHIKNWTPLNHNKSGGKQVSFMNHWNCTIKHLQWLIACVVISNF